MHLSLLRCAWARARPCAREHTTLIGMNFYVVPDDVQVLRHYEADTICGMRVCARALVCV